MNKLKHVGELFKKRIDRKIEEVIKVDQADEETVKNEIEEYVATDSIIDHFKMVYESVAKYQAEPHEGIGVWVSGFFGAGKSSFAKILGYTLADRQVMGKSSSALFLDNVRDTELKAFLQNINSRFSTHAVIFDVSMDRGVRTASERITEIMYKALLRELGYSEDFDLAELEMALEAKGKLVEFERLFNSSYPFIWEEEKDQPLAIVEASVILHKMMPEIFSSPDSWSNSLSRNSATGEFIGRADITPNKLAQRAFELMSVRKPDQELIFVIDEVGQYVAKSEEKMLDLQAIIQAFGVESKNRVKARQAVAPVWVVVTSQQKLEEVVDYIDSKKIELARLQDRFPIQIDLKQSDIQEVTGKRVLDKNPGAEQLLKDIYEKTEGQLKTHCSLERTSRNVNITRDDFVRLYPYLPYQIDLSIDIVAGLRLKRGAQKHIGGSNRTIIKQAQQMLINPRTSLASKDIGTLVTLDKIYELLSVGNLLQLEVTKEVDDVSKILPGNEMASKVAKAIALLEVVKDLPRTARNIAASLHPTVESASVLKDVEKAIEALEKAQVIRETEEGYKLLTIQEKNWDTDRARIELKPKFRNTIKRDIAKELLSESKLTMFRYNNISTFKIGLTVDEQAVEDGSIVVNFSIADDSEEYQKQLTQNRETSRLEKHKDQLFWVIPLNEEIHKLIEELYKSREMVSIYTRLRAQNQITPEESSCLEEEKIREDRIHVSLKTKFAKAGESGIGFFRGVQKDSSILGSSFGDIIKNFVEQAIPDIYNKLELGSVPLKNDEAAKFLSAANFNGLNPFYYDNSGLGLVTKQSGKYVANPNAEIAKEILDYIKTENSYGEKVTGKSVENYFAKAPYGWKPEILHLVLAVLFKAGAIEVTHQGKKYKNPSDPISRQPFSNNNAFRAATFVPRETMNLKILTEAAKHFEDITGNEVDIEEASIAEAFQKLALEDKELVLPLEAKMLAYKLPGIQTVTDFKDTITTVINSEVDDSVKLLATEGKTYKEVRDHVRKLSSVLTDKTLSIIYNGRTVIYTTLPQIDSFIEDTLREEASELRNILESDDLFTKLEPVEQTSNKISEVYKQRYGELHSNRLEVYQKAISSVKNHPAFETLLESYQSIVLVGLEKKLCSYELDSSSVCTECRSTLREMETDVVAVETLKKEAMEKIDQLTAPSEKIAYVSLDSLVSGTIESKEDTEKIIESIRKHLLKMIAEGMKIVLR